MRLLGAAFEKTSPGVDVQVLPSLGSSGAVRAVAAGAVEIGVMSRPLKAKEKRLPFDAVELSKTPCAFVSRRGVPVSSVDGRIIASIYKGETFLWPDGTRIRPILRPISDGDNTIVQKISAVMPAALDAARSRKGIVTAMTDQQNADLLEQTPGSFGLICLAQILSEERSLNILDYAGVRPGVKTLLNGTYSIQKTFFVITLEQASSVTREFLEFLRSTEAKGILERTGQFVVLR